MNVDAIVLTNAAIYLVCILMMKAKHLRGR
jgi:hypothetical protein